MLKLSYNELLYTKLNPNITPISNNDIIVISIAINKKNMVF